MYDKTKPCVEVFTPTASEYENMALRVQDGIFRGNWNKMKVFRVCSHDRLGPGDSRTMMYLLGEMSL